MSLPVASWSTEVFNMQCFGYAPMSLQVNWPALGLMECILILSGTVRYVGFESDKLPGGDFKEKRKGLFQTTIDPLTQIATDGGFVVDLSPGLVYVFPSGFVRAIACGADGVKGIRWSMSSDDADLVRVKLTVGKLIDSFPELRQPSAGYQQFLDFLESD